MKHEVLRLLAFAAAAYVAAIVYVAIAESREVFPGAFKPRPDRIPDLPSDAQPVELVTSDGVRLAAHELAPLDSASASPRWAIFFSGQWGRTRWDLPKLLLLREAGWSVLTFDYRGYGGSRGTPSETGFYRDADAALAHLTGTRGVPAERIILYGHSLGSAVAIDLASRQSVGGLIVDGAFSSVPASASERFPWLPVEWIAQTKFASIAKIERVATPKLFLHGLYDETNRVEHSRALLARAPGPKRLVELEGRHEDFQWSDPERFRTAVAEFLATL